MMFRSISHGFGFGTVFNREYVCYPISFFAAEQQRDEVELEYGDKIILPPSALHHLSSLQISFPMLFKVRNPESGQCVHCGVLEFCAQEGVCYIPSWIMNNISLSEGAYVNVINLKLPKGTSVTLQPHTSDFIKISNPRAVLEMSLRKFSALTKGQSIRLFFNNKMYDLHIVQVGSSSPMPDNAISIIETDVAVEFAPPKDTEEKESSVPHFRGRFPVYPEDDPDPSSSSSEEEAGKTKKPKRPSLNSAFVGTGKQLSTGQASGKPLDELRKEMEEAELKKQMKAKKTESEKEEGKKDGEAATEEKRFEAFKGKGNILKRSN